MVLPLIIQKAREKKQQSSSSETLENNHNSTGTSNISQVRGLLFFCITYQLIQSMPMKWFFVINSDTQNILLPNFPQLLFHSKYINSSCSLTLCLNTGSIDTPCYSWFSARFTDKSDMRTFYNILWLWLCYDLRIYDLYAYVWFHCKMFIFSPKLKTMIYIQTKLWMWRTLMISQQEKIPPSHIHIWQKQLRKFYQSRMHLLNWQVNIFEHWNKKTYTWWSIKYEWYWQ